MTNRIPNQQFEIGPLVGKLLVAGPSNSKEAYARSVSWIVHQDETTVSGIQLNCPVKFQFPGLELGAAHSELIALLGHPLHLGGPLAGPVVAIHQEPDLADLSNSDGLCIAADQSKISELLKRQPNRMRLIAGYSRWNSETLARELQAGDWFVLPAAPELIFATDRELWYRCVTILGRALMHQAAGVSFLQSHPWLN